MADLTADRDAIRHLLARYTYNGDRGRIEELAACFCEDGILEYPGNCATGPRAVAAVLSQDRNEGGPAPTFVRHHITNPLIETDGDIATARSYFTVVSDSGPDHSGTYNDRLVRTANGWLFSHRLVRIDWQSSSSLFRRMTTR